MQRMAGTTAHSVASFCRRSSSACAARSSSLEGLSSSSALAKVGSLAKKILSLGVVKLRFSSVVAGALHWKIVSVYINKTGKVQFLTELFGPHQPPPPRLGSTDSPGLMFTYRWSSR